MMIISRGVANRLRSTHTILIELIKFIAIAKDDMFRMFQLSMYEVMLKIEITVHIGSWCVIETQEHDSSGK